MAGENVLDTRAGMRRGVSAAEAAIRALAPRERRVLGAYIHFAKSGGRVSGACWPTDDEVAGHLAVSLSTVRRARRRLRSGSAPFLAVEHVPAFGVLPDGTTTLKGAVVVLLLPLGDPDEAPAVRALVAATAEMKQLELALEGARERVRALEDDVRRIHDQAARNDTASFGPRPVRRAPEEDGDDVAGVA
jgi:hypothetical protein